MDDKEISLPRIKDSMIGRRDREQPILYAHRTLYQWTVRTLYGRYYKARYAAVAAEIPRGAQVVDVCAGDCYLYLGFLQQKPVEYLGLDRSPALVRWAQARGAMAVEFDLLRDPLPIGDVLVLQASLYQFMPEADTIIHRLLSAARDRVVVSEPIRNFTDPANGSLARLSRFVLRVIAGESPKETQRFTRQTLTSLFNSFEAFEHSSIIPGGREMIGVFAGRCRS